MKILNFFKKEVQEEVPQDSELVEVQALEEAQEEAQEEVQEVEVQEEDSKLTEYQELIKTLEEKIQVLEAKNEVLEAKNEEISEIKGSEKAVEIVANLSSPSVAIKEDVIEELSEEQALAMEYRANPQAFINKYYQK